MPVQLSGAVLKGAQVNSASPAALFAAGEQGVWFDPSDMSTMFQDSIGTIPVTGFEQPVGLILDKKRGLEPDTTNKVTEDISAASWIKDGVGITANQLAPDGSLTAFNVVPSIGAGDKRVRQQTTYLQGKNYAFSVYVKANGYNYIRLLGTSGAFPAAIFNLSNGTVVSGAGTIAPAGNGYYKCTMRFYQSAADTDSVFNNQIGISADGVTWAYAGNGTSGVLMWKPELFFGFGLGNHAAQATSASRPVLSARYNILSYTEDFSNSYWQKFTGNVTRTDITNPFGVNNASEFVSTSTNGALSLPLGVTVIPNTNYTFSAWLKVPSGTNVVNFAIAGSGYGNIIGINANLTTEWQKFVVSGPIGSLSNVRVLIGGNNSIGLDEVIHIWGADLRVANDGVGIPSYQRVGAATYGSSSSPGTADYDTAGFPPYLRFDGVDDGMSTSSIDFSATDEISIFAGVRKLSDTSAIVAELSTSIGNVGSFYLVSGEDNSGRYSSSSRGTEPANPAQASLWTGNNFAPDTSVLSATHDISNDLSTIRRNTISGTNGSFDKGTGNFGNYPLYIGNRSNNSIRLNGRLYQLIIRGTQTSQSLIDAIETWTNLKTRAY